MNHRSSFSTLIIRSASLVRVLASRAATPPFWVGNWWAA